MEPREQRIYEEAVALWREVFHEPPPLRTDGTTMLEIIMRCAGPPPYERLHSPHLRPSTIVGPAQPKDDAHLG
ncbi:hypothetical protein [Phenylobacterium sp.]|jgi:hypothetical protein|uniref:hypothetical protein n=1 Tax=Phenylobacterium sp. TaxID=1871053 RepID=UPI002E324BD8|nr:hypothetical protein [Phenylobacterium sp.]HEX3367716.1 hypothetical protein [Phenylobacterium sp.]